MLGVTLRLPWGRRGQSVIAIGLRLRARGEVCDGEDGSPIAGVLTRDFAGVSSSVASALVLLAPFPDDGQRILDVFVRVGVGVGVKNLSLGRNHIGNAVGEGRADNRDVGER